MDLKSATTLKNDIELKEKESTQKNMLKVAELIRKKKKSQLDLPLLLFDS